MTDHFGARSRAPARSLPPPSNPVAKVFDAERTGRLVEAVEAVVRPGDRVVELGAGSSLLSLVAARAGAEAVDAYEPDPLLAATARRNIAANGAASVVQVLEEDPATCTFSGPYDVVIVDHPGVALVDPPMIAGFNNLVVQPVLAWDVRTLPTSHSTFLELVEADFEVHGLRLPMPRPEATWADRPVRSSSTTLRLVSNLDLVGSARAQRIVSEQVVAMLDVEIRHSGRVNALRMTSMTHLAPGVELGWTPTANAPLVVPVPERTVTVGSIVPIELSYRMGAGAASLRFGWADLD